MHAPITETEGREIERERDHGDINHINKNKTKKRHAIHARTHARTHARPAGNKNPTASHLSERRASLTHIPTHTGPLVCSGDVAEQNEKVSSNNPTKQKNKRRQGNKKTKKSGRGGRRRDGVMRQPRAFNQSKSSFSKKT